MIERTARRFSWSGLVGGAAAWALQYQLVVDLLHFGCPPAMHRIGLASGIGASALALLTGAVSWRAARALPRESGADAHRLIAWMSVLAAAVSIVAIALQTAATWIVPACAR